VRAGQQGGGQPGRFGQPAQQLALVVVRAMAAHNGHGPEQAHREGAAPGHVLVAGGELARSALPDEARRVGRNVLLAYNGHPGFLQIGFELPAVTQAKAAQIELAIGQHVAEIALHRRGQPGQLGLVVHPGRAVGSSGK
jgi:hypothetical protein